jgi:phosphopantothenoylcysteine decarboxylase/phosphopantothenate--cysteine ligase|tara:strand:- start:17981 stop:19213 length:1233 start_codon:yes stop_codon:yes gene_type:complete
MKNILLGVTGSIAAYKSPELVRQLRAHGFSIKVVLTESAKEFVTETTLQAVSLNPVRSNLWDKEAEAVMTHIELARWADYVLIAPTTANVMAKIAQGSANDLLTTLCLATKAKIVISPAMNHIMWGNSAVQENRNILLNRGIVIIEPEIGDQACGETGIGRMPEPEFIVETLINKVMNIDRPLIGMKVLITAGPTRESIDPIRYITNRSSGKMGYALASEFRAAGAEVHLVSGPTNLPKPQHMTLTYTETADDMLKTVHNNINDVDIFVSAAAVVDYRPAVFHKNKIKKLKNDLIIELVKSEDVLASVSELKIAPFTVGFAAETHRLKEYALKKLNDKSLDMIIANKVGPNDGFDQDDNAVNVFWGTSEKIFKKMAKDILAKKLVLLIAEKFQIKFEQKNKKSSNITSIR